MKSFDMLIAGVVGYNSELKNPEIPPHSSNLLHQLSKREESKLPFFNVVCDLYFKMRESAKNTTLELKEYVTSVVEATNDYMDLFLTKNPFSHQADFTSSIIPEMFFLMMYRVIKDLRLNYIVSAQSEVPIELMFDLQGGSRLMYKTKRLDMLVCKKSQITLDNNLYDFIIPLITMEMKTNLDKNMMSGIENSVSALKRTFPHCLYYVVTELSDMALDKLNYASSDIDEIYIIRKQKRASVRSKKEAKKNIDSALIYEIVSECKHQMSIVDDVVEPIEIRMQTGKLIN